MADIWEDPQVAGQIRVIVDRIYERLASVREVLGEVSTTVTKTSETAKKGVQELSDEYNVMIDRGIDGSIKLSQSWDKFTGDMKTSLQNLADSPAGKLILGGEGRGAITGKQTGFEGLASAARGMQSQIFSGLPMGGIMGLLLGGLKYESEARAVGERSLQIFRKVGDFGSAGAAAFGKHVENASVQLAGFGQDINAVFNAMAEGGVKSAEAGKKAIHPFEGFESNLNETTLAMDKLWGQAAGTNAQQAAKLAADSGAAMRDSVETLTKIGFAAQNSGLSYSAFTGAVAQASSALRVQRVDTTDVARSLKGLQEAAAGAYGVGAGSMTAGQRGAEALSGIAGNIAGMPEGLRVIIGQRLALRAGLGQISATDAILKMSEGFKTGPGATDAEKEVQKNFMRYSMQETKSYGKENMGGDPGLLLQYFTKSQHLDENSSRTLIAMSDDMSELSELGPQQLAEMQKTYGAASAQKSDFDKLLDAMQVLIKEVGATLVLGVGTLVRIVGGIFDFFAVWATEGFGVAGRAAAHTAELIGVKWTEQFDKLSKLSTGAMGDALSMLGPLVLSDMPGTVSPVGLVYAPEDIEQGKSEWLKDEDAQVNTRRAAQRAKEINGRTGAAAVDTEQAPPPAEGGPTASLSVRGEDGKTYHFEQATHLRLRGVTPAATEEMA